MQQYLSLSQSIISLLKMLLCYEMEFAAIHLHKNLCVTNVGVLKPYELALMKLVIKNNKSMYSLQATQFFLSSSCPGDLINVQICLMNLKDTFHMRKSYLWDFIKPQNVVYVLTDVRVWSCNYRNCIVLAVTFIIRNEFVLTGEKLH